MGVQPTPGMSVEQAVEKQLGIKDLDAIVQQQAVEYLVPFAIDKRNITPAFPALPKAAGPLKRGQTFSFEVRVTPKPDYELKSYEPVSITVPPFEIEQAEVEEQIAQIAESYAEFVSDEPHPVEKGDGFLLALEAFQNGEKMDNLSTEGRTYLTGMGLMPEDFEKHLIGMNVGETKSFSFDLPGMNADDKGDTVDCTVTVKEMQKKVVPAIDDEWVAKNLPMYRDAAALRGGITDRLTADRRAQYEAYKLQVAASELAKRFEGRIQDEVYEAMQQTLVSNLRGQLQDHDDADPRDARAGLRAGRAVPSREDDPHRRGHRRRLPFDEPAEPGRREARDAGERPRLRSARGRRAHEGEPVAARSCHRERGAAGRRERDGCSAGSRSRLRVAITRR